MRRKKKKKKTKLEAGRGIKQESLYHSGTALYLQQKSSLNFIPFAICCCGGGLKYGRICTSLALYKALSLQFALLFLKKSCYFLSV